MTALERAAKNNNFTDFEREYYILYPRATATDAAASFNAHKSVYNNKTSGGGSSDFSSVITAGIGSKENLTLGINDTLGRQKNGWILLHFA